MQQDEQPAGRFALRRAPWALLTVGVGLACAASALPFLARAWWALELTCHFRMHYFLFLAPASVLLLIGRKPRRAALAGAFALLNLALIVPVYAGGPPPDASGTACRVLWINVHRFNTRYEEVRRFIGEADADVVAIAEVNAAWMRELAPLIEQYPTFVALPAESSFGIMLMSRLPLKDAHIQLLSTDGGARPGTPCTVAHLELDGREVLLLGVHVVPPMSSSSAARRNDGLKEVAALARGEHSEVVIMGDLNATPWSPYFTELLRAGGLRDSRRGFGIHATWPAPFGVLGIPIDHCLVSPGVVVRDRRVGPQVGSDHRPLMVDFSLAAP